jgi:hypothetical protein
MMNFLPLGVGEGVGHSGPGGLGDDEFLPLGVGEGVGPTGPGVGTLGQVGILQHLSFGSVVMKQDCGNVANLRHLIYNEDRKFPNQLILFF